MAASLYRDSTRATVQQSMAVTTHAPIRCGSSLMPEWRNAAPRINCTHTQAAVIAASAGVRGVKPCSTIGSESCSQLLPVNSAIAVTTQKIVCASVACAVEIAHGR